MTRNIEGMKRLIAEDNKNGSMLNRSAASSKFMIDDSSTMSFLKGADRDQEMRDTLDFAPAGLKQTGIKNSDAMDEYFEWDQMTSRHDENYECSSEARDYNNQEIDDTKSEIQIEDGPEPE